MKSNLMALIIFNVIVLGLSWLSGTLIFTTIIISNIIVFWWLRSKDEIKIIQNKNIVLVMTILNFLSFNIISGAMCASLYSQMNRLGQFYASNNNMQVSVKPISAVPKVDPQIKRIDILLKLGMGMVFVAGFIFATTGWNSLNTVLKVLLFLIIALLFIWLSKFCEKKLKIKSTVYLYWILGMAFIMFIIFIIGDNSLFGNYFSFNGEGNLLYSSFCSMSLSFLGLVSYYNFKNKRFLNIVYVGGFISILLVFNHFKLSYELILMLFVGLLTIPQLLKIEKNKDLYTLVSFSNVMLPVLGIMYIFLCLDYKQVLLVGLTYVLFVYNMYKHVLSSKISDFNYLVPFLSYVLLIPFLTLVIKESIIVWTLVTSIFSLILYFVCLMFKNDKLSRASLITANILTGISFLMAFFGPNWLPLVISLFFIAIYICYCTFGYEDEMFEYTIQPIKISAILMGIFFLFNHVLLAIDLLSYWIVLNLLLFILIYCLIKNEKISKIYEGYSLATIIFCLLFIPHSQNLVSSLVSFISIIVFFDEINSKEKNSYIRNLIFGLLLYNLFVGTHAIMSNLMNYLELNAEISLISNILVTLSFIVISILYKDDKFKLNMSLFGIIVPIISLGTTLNYDWLSMVLPSIFVYYLTFNICRLINATISKDIVGYIGYSLSFLLVIFNNNYYVLGYTCILLFLSLLIGYLDKKYNALFRMSIVAVIVLILYQLKEFWNQVPAWLYLLLLGIALIVFATYKQLKMLDKNEKKESDKS